MDAQNQSKILPRGRHRNPGFAHGRGRVRVHRRAGGRRGELRAERRDAPRCLAVRRLLAVETQVARVVELGDRLAGLVVDGVTDVFGAGEPDQRSVPQIGVGDAARGISAVYIYDGKLVFVLDVDRIAAVTEVIDIEAMHGLIERGGA